MSQNPNSAIPYRIGDAVYVRSHGQWRRGVVGKIGRTRVTVTVTTNMRTGRTSTRAFPAVDVLPGHWHLPSCPYCHGGIPCPPATPAPAGSLTYDPWRLDWHISVCGRASSAGAAAARARYEQARSTPDQPQTQHEPQTQTDESGEVRS